MGVFTRRSVILKAAAAGIAGPGVASGFRGGEAAAQEATPSVAGGDPIRIGAPYNLTGAVASFDGLALKGAELAVEEINAAGGVLGRPLEMIVMDGEYDLAKTEANTRALIEDEGVDVLVGLSDTDHMWAGGSVAQAAGIPFLDVGGTAPEIVDIGDYIFMTPFGDNAQAAAGADFAKSRGASRAAILYDESTKYTTVLADYFEEAFITGDEAGSVVAKLPFRTGSGDFATQVAVLSAMQTPPDFLYLAALGEDAGPIIAAARAAGLKMPAAGGDGLEGPDLVAAAGPVSDVFFTTHQGVYDESEKTTAFVSAFEEKYGEKPSSVMAALGYDAIYLMAAAIERAGSTDGAAVRDAFVTMEPFDGVTGTIDFPGKSQVPVKPVALIEVVDGRNRLLELTVPDNVPE